MKRKRQRLVSACLILMLSAWGCLHLGADTAADIQKGMEFHARAETDPEGNIQKGKEILLPLIGTEPLAKGYYGSLVTLEAGVHEKNGNVIKAMSALNEGCRLLDEAVSEDAQSTDLRFLRMINSYELSCKSPANRYKIMKEDIGFLMERQESLAAADASLLYLYSGYYLVKARKLEQALESFARCVELCPESESAVRAKKELLKYEE